MFGIDISDLTTLIAKNISITFGYIIAAAFAQLLSRTIVHRIIKQADRIDDRIAKRVDDTLTPRLETIQSILLNTSSIGIWGVAIVMLLAAWGVNITPIITGAGVIGLAVGFGAQTLVKDVVSGFFILFENQYNVGERVDTAGIVGIVEKINLRTTIFRDDNNSIHIIPNSQVLKVTKNLPPKEETTEETAE